MRRLLLIVLPLLLIVGCSKPVEESTLINKDGVMYLPNSDSPYSGEVFINYSTGEKLYQGTYENGLLVQYSYLNRDGSVKEPLNESTLLKRGELMYEANSAKPYTGQVFELHANGQKAFEGIYKDGFRHGDWTYYTEVGNGKYNVPYTAGTYTVAVFTDNLGTDYTGSPSRHREAYQDGTYFLRKEDKYDFSIYPMALVTVKDGEMISRKNWDRDGNSYRNIYESKEFKTLSDKDIFAGESIWATTCFRCHMYGSNGGTVLTDKEYWDKMAAKGFDELYSSVLNGKEGVSGVMPPKGLCNSCSEDEIKKSVYYIFHLAKIVQDAESEKLLRGKD